MAVMKIQTVIQSTARSVRRCCITVYATLLIVMGFNAGPSMASPLEALRNGDMDALIQEVIGIYEDHEISWAAHISWDIQTYETVYWYYSPREKKIVVGDLPSQNQITDYWQIWSLALTDGNWEPDSFFKSPADAYDMALFNQYVLTIHESAHAVTYRYDPDHRSRHDYEVNCREFYADRLTAAMLQHTAQQQPDLDRMRKRYLDLVRSMHRAIPDQFLVASADYSDLVENCAIIEVDQPTPDALQAYASAYFTRWEALLSVDLPPLETVFETHLKKRLQKRFDWVQPATEWSKGRVQTLRKTDRLAGRILNAGRVLEDGKRAAAFGPDGILWFAEARFNKETSELEYAYGMAENATDPQLQTMRWPRESRHITLRSIASFGADRFVATFEENPYRTSLIEFEFRDGKWTPRTLAEWQNTSKAFVFRTQDNRVFAGLTHFFDKQTETTDKTYWTFEEYDLETAQILGSHDIRVESKEAVALDGAGRLYLTHQRQIFRVDRLQDVARIAGTGLEGVRDGPIDQADIGWVQVMQFFPDGSALLLADDPGDSDRQMIRKLVPPPHR